NDAFPRKYPGRSLIGALPDVTLLYTNKLSGIFASSISIGAMSSLLIKLTLGINIPFLAASTSKAAAAFGVGVPIPTCAFATRANAKRTVVNKIFFML